MSPEPPQMVLHIKDVDTTFNSKMVGGTIDVTDIQLTEKQKRELSFDSQDFDIPIEEISKRFSESGKEEKLPNFSARIEDVLNHRTLVVQI